MPSKPAWYAKLDEITAELKALPVQFVHRAIIERLLGVGRRRAQQILLPCISVRVGASGLADRDLLIERLRGVAQSDENYFETQRRRKLGETLGKLRQQQIEQPRVMVEAPVSVLNSRIQNLPEGVSLEPGRIVVTFSDPQEALQKLLAIAMAAGNDLGGFEEAVKVNA
jgi:hypothetical protein